MMHRKLAAPAPDLSVLLRRVEKESRIIEETRQRSFGAGRGCLGGECRDEPVEGVAARYPTID